jgi:hypothetical protein
VRRRRDLAASPAGRPQVLSPGEPTRSALWAVGIVVVFAPLAVRVYRRKT